MVCRDYCRVRCGHVEGLIGRAHVGLRDQGRGLMLLRAMDEQVRIGVGAQTLGGDFS